MCGPRNFIFSMHDLHQNISAAIYFTKYFGICRSRSKGSTSIFYSVTLTFQYFAISLLDCDSHKFCLKHNCSLSPLNPRCFCLCFVVGYGHKKFCIHKCYHFGDGLSMICDVDVGLYVEHTAGCLHNDCLWVLPGT